MICEICYKEIPEDPFFSDDHHLIPKSKRGKDVIKIHRICHNKIHSLWTEKELMEYYHTPERIRQHQEMKAFISWLKNKPNDFYVKTKDSTNRRKKRKR